LLRDERGITFQRMDLSWLHAPGLIAVAALLLWALSERLFQWFGMSQPNSPEAEKASLYWLQVSYFGSVVFAALDATVLRWTTLPPKLMRWTYLGLPLVAAGITMRMAARCLLGKHFSGNVQTTCGHELVTSGLYRHLQHPAYLGYLFLLSGFPLSFGSLGGLAFALLSGVPALIYRIRVEEACMATWFGDDYKRYHRRTPRLLPGVW
jgi:protein-S-isoprenylcysteine O-methyltransferase Ste14